MRSSSPLLSYQQVLTTRQCPLSEREVIALLLQLLTEVSKLHAIGQIHGNLSLEHLWRDVEGELYMHPAAQTRSGWTARDDVRSIAQVAIILLTNRVFHPDWQSYSQIRAPLAKVLAAALNFTVEIPIRDAADLLNAIYLVHAPQSITIPEVIPTTTAAAQPWQTQVKKSIVQAKGLGLLWLRKIMTLISVLLLMSLAVWMAYENFSTFLPDRPAVNLQISPSPTPSSSLKTQDTQDNQDQESTDPTPSPEESPVPLLPTP